MTIIGRIVGKITTSHFSFKIETEAKKFDFVQVCHKEYGFVLCQIVELERLGDDYTAVCNIIGYKDESDNRVKLPRSTFEPSTEVLFAENSLVEAIIKLDDSAKGAYLGLLDGKDIPVYLDMNKLLTKHVVVLAKSGAGKSYCVGVLLEEIIEKNIPLLIIDPHGEYSSLKSENDKDKDLMIKYNIKPKAYVKNIREYGDFKIDRNLVPLKLSNRMGLKELLNIIPVKLSNNQTGLLYDTLRNVPNFSFSELKFALEQQDSNVKWSLIGIIESLESLNLFGEGYTSLNEIIRPGRCSIINLKGMPQAAQEIVTYKLLHDLFEARKLESIPPFFCVIEEAHNFCPERSFGETKASSIIRNIASEGRKFGLGLAVISQRPARLDKSVISQCTTQIILKITNPNDLKTVQNSVEGITQESMGEIKNLPVGSAMVCGLVDMPLFVNIRPRKTKHGGEAIDMLNQDVQLMEELNKFEDENKKPLIYPQTTFEEFKLMHNKDWIFKKKLIPAIMFNCSQKDNEYKILIELDNGEVVLNVDTLDTAKLPDLDKLSRKEIQTLSQAFQLKKFSLNGFIQTNGSGLDIKITLDNLVKKGFLLGSSTSYELNPKVILGSLNEFACFEKIRFESIDLKTEPINSNLDEIKTHLKRFTEIIDYEDCYIVKYEAMPSN
ncbi:ATP-binding protein [Candidatus Woesearchaeota archaeon]|nr:ATP-binding protein [Candidatus Woesearchaeota archaeon]